MYGFIGPLRPGQKPSSNSLPSTSANPYPAPNTSSISDIGKFRKQRKFLRVAGGTTWEDPTLNEWDSDDYRVFCGDLGNEVTDEMLVKTFEKYPSFGKARIVRDKRTGKTRGYGFVSFKDPLDYAKAIKEWDGKYVGSRPIKLRKSTWRDRNIEVKSKKLPNSVNLDVVASSASEGF